MRPPLKIEFIEHDPDHLMIDHTGQKRAAPMIFLAEGEIEKLRSGYYCAMCFDPQEEAFPKNCRICGFAMRDEQTAYVGKHYSGEVAIDNGVDIKDEMERLRELQKELDISGRDSILRPTQILLPGKDF